MANQTHIHPADVHGISHLAIEATLGLTSLVEAMHHNIARIPGVLGEPTDAPTRGITGLVYASIRGVTRLVDGGLDALLRPLVPLLGERGSSPERDCMLGALNGVVGDHLAASGNPLAIPMRLRHGGQALDLTGPALATAIPRPSAKILLLIHGLCLADWNWRRERHDHGAALAEYLGYTPVYLYYNTGLHISINGRALADVLAALLQHWPAPMEELAIIGHSMGGLVARSACRYGALAGHAWPRQLRKIVFLGTPHHGAPLEQIGNWLHAMLGASPYTAAFTRLAKIRSAGITDLRYGNLLDEDWVDRDRFAHAGDQRRPVPLPAGVECYSIAATTGTRAGDLRDQLFGDGLVPLRSALGQHADPGLNLAFSENHQWVGYDMNHLDLLQRRDVYEQLRRWLAS